MTRIDFVKQIEATYKKCLGILEKKNKDYAGETDPWRNFRWSELADIDVPHAIMVRILDKMARISNLLTKEADVKEEKIEDTIEDAINYLAILLAFLKDNK